MVVTWIPLTLPEARGFITSYTVFYSPQVSRGKRQEHHTMQKAVSGNVNQTTINGLDPNTAYDVQMSANTTAGASALSEVISAQVPSDTGNITLHVVSNSGLFCVGYAVHSYIQFFLYSFSLRCKMVISVFYINSIEFKLRESHIMFGFALVFLITIMVLLIIGGLSIVVIVVALVVVLALILIIILLVLLVLKMRWTVRYVIS